MTEVKDVMTRKVVTLAEEMPLLEASRILVSNRIGGAPVVGKEGAVLGVLSESDVIRTLKGPLAALKETGRRGRRYGGLDEVSLVRQALAFVSMDWLWYRWNMRSVDRIFEALEESEALTRLTVKDAMASEVVSIGPDEPIEKAIKLMNEHDTNRLPVMDARGRLVGIVARNDMLVAVSRELNRGGASRRT